MIKKAAQDGLNWLIIVLVANIIGIPFSMLVHKPLLNGLLEMFMAIGNKWLAILALIGSILFCWLVIFLISLSVRKLIQLFDHRVANNK
ncbi:hypothetical protein [Lentilactobacillus sp. SPB1-3]|uniref:Uncharacterized protein n=1 Tax=Lentilactobacillus terminaliae TaxID=3003483 RepID=A0ACD5DG61_9LACO|nr:hypothetical protein [Lentilactobacillus sp. SPB1-3]MCZ0976563.1 hypothetical protein [Lentilactobacillus sp. SPB1-3]